MPSLFAPLVSGTLFGATLHLSRLTKPSTFLCFFTLTNTHLLTIFLTASLLSTLIIYTTNKFTSLRLPHRTNSSYGWFSAYDANIVGGLLQGLGMAITGADPGTALVQVVVRVHEAVWIVVGGVLGGLAFVCLGEKLRRQAPREEVERLRQERIVGHTVTQRLEVGEGVAVVGYTILLAVGVVVLIWLGGKQGAKGGPFGNGVGTLSWSLSSPVAGGLMIGVAQAGSVLLSKKTLGISTAYPDLAAQVVGLVNGKGLNGNWSNILFAVGVMLGGWLASQWVPLPVEHPRLSVLAALVGGFCNIFGARLAGGCTSGHGMSGMSTLSISSFVTVASMLGGGILFRRLLHST